MTNATTINWAIMSGIIQAATAAVEAKADSATYRRWRNALKRAVEELHSNPRIAYENGTLIVLSDESNTLYEIEANGRHEGCAAYERNTPCYHRCLRRLLDLYEQAVAFPQNTPGQASVPDVLLHGAQPKRHVYTQREPSEGFKAAQAFVKEAVERINAPSMLHAAEAAVFTPKTLAGEVYKAGGRCFDV